MHRFDDPWPPFLDLLNSNPKRACELFYIDACKLFKVSPPYIIGSVPAGDRPDLFHSIVVHCVKDNFRVLRTYKNEGKPFAKWFKRTATNKVLEWLRKRGKPDCSSDCVGGDCDSTLERVDPAPITTPEMREMLDITNQCIAELNMKCRMLLRFAAEEFTPREMALMVGLDPQESKRVSNDLRYCRQKLAKLVTQRGVVLELVTP